MAKSCLRLVGAVVWAVSSSGCTVNLDDLTFDDEQYARVSGTGAGDAGKNGGDGNGGDGDGGDGDDAGCSGSDCVDTCSDGRKNGEETDTDCGGRDCDPCKLGDDCTRARDCNSGVCAPIRNQCVAACVDSDEDGRCADVDSDDTNPHCWSSDEVDADEDGYCEEDDPNDNNPHCYLTPSVDGDGDDFCVETDSDDDKAGCQTSAIDEDGDDYCADSDSDDENPNCVSSTTDEDNDDYCDEVDADDGNPNCTSSNTDADSDTYCAETDADDDNSFCYLSPASDEDGDGRCAEEDSDDTNPHCYVKGEVGVTELVDNDGDGYCVENDSNDENAYCTTSTADPDRDGYCNEHDSVDNNPRCYLEPMEDADADEYCAETDSDESNPFCNFNAIDNDGDGECYCQTGNCDQSDCDDGDINRNHIDFDADGSSTCAQDCNDNERRVFPGNMERCDGVDNDCDGSYDDSDIDCGGNGSCYYDADNDGQWGCSDSCPQVPLYPTRIYFSWLSVTCSDFAEYRDFYINETYVATGASVSTDCGCSHTEIASAEVGNLAVWDVYSTNTLSTEAWSYADEGVTWMKATIEYGDFSDEVCMQGDCSAVEVCDSDFCWTAGSGFLPSCNSISANYFSGDEDGDGAGNPCDCNDSEVKMSPRLPELCDDGIDNNCNGLIDNDDDACNGGCKPTAFNEIGLCDDEDDNDCDGFISDGDADNDGAPDSPFDPDCRGVTCAAAEELGTLQTYTMSNFRSRNTTLCNMQPDTAVSAPEGCSAATYLADAWQRVTFNDPYDQGYQVQVCLQNDAGEVVVSTDDDCSIDLCAASFIDPGSCVTLPANGTQTWRIGYRTEVEGCVDFYTSVSVFSEPGPI